MCKLYRSKKIKIKTQVKITKYKWVNEKRPIKPIKSVFAFYKKKSMHNTFYLGIISVPSKWNGTRLSEHFLKVEISKGRRNVPSSSQPCLRGLERVLQLHNAISCAKLGERGGQSNEICRRQGSKPAGQSHWNPLPSQRWACQGER